MNRVIAPTLTTSALILAAIAFAIATSWWIKAPALALAVTALAVFIIASPKQLSR